MRVLVILLFSLFVLIAPASGIAESTVVDKVAAAAKENPATTAGVAGCAAVLIFPPAAIWCLATIAGGATVDVATE